MQYRWQKCVDPALSAEKTENAEVSLSEFAAIGGLTESEYSRRLFDKLQSGNLMDLLTIKGQYSLGEWISEKFLDNKDDFLVVLKLSLNRIRDVALFCVCSMNMTTEEPTIYVRHAIPGLIDNPPPEAADLEGFEVSFYDMEPSI